MDKTAFLFPGQGSQAIGMCRNFYHEFPPVKEVFDIAEEVSKIKIKDLCFNGPMEELTQTINLQPVLTAANLASLMALKTAFSTEPCVWLGLFPLKTPSVLCSKEGSSWSGNRESIPVRCQPS